MMLMKRRDFLKVGAAAGAMASLYGCAGGGKASVAGETMASGGSRAAAGAIASANLRASRTF